MANYYVTRDRDTGDWMISREFSMAAIDFALTCSDAVEIAERMARESGGGRVRVLGEDHHFNGAGVSYTMAKRPEKIKVS